MFLQTSTVPRVAEVTREAARGSRSTHFHATQPATAPPTALTALTGTVSHFNAEELPLRAVCLKDTGLGKRVR